MEKEQDNIEETSEDGNETIAIGDDDDATQEEESIQTAILEDIESLPDVSDVVEIKIESDDLTNDGMEDEEIDEMDENTYLSASDDNAIAIIDETENSSKVHSLEITSNNNLVAGEDVGKIFGFEQAILIVPTDEHNGVIDIRATSSSSSSSVQEYMASVFTEDNIMSSTNSQFQEEKSLKVELINQNPNQKCHNLSIPELRKKLAFCPICQIQYTNHKLANMCLAKHGKRQCWLCLDILSSKKDEFYKHCIDNHSISKNGDIVGT